MTKQLSAKYEGEFKKTKGELCIICYENELTKKNTFTFEKCGHKFCDKCVKDDFREKIKDSVLNKFHCLQGCEKSVVEVQLKKIFKDDLATYEKYEKFVTRAKVESNPLFSYCPRPGKTPCMGFSEAKTMTQKYVTCE